MLEYEVISIEPGSWLVTAKEVASGEIVKFQLPPSAFKGKSFDAELGNIKQGQKFGVRSPNNDSLSNLVVHKGLPLKNERDRKHRQPLIKRELLGPPTPPLKWEILEVDPQAFIVTARNRQNAETAKFKVDPAAFRGFRFKANLRGIRQGQGFKLVAREAKSFQNACTLLEMKKGR